LRIGSDETHVGAEAELESAAEGYAVDGRDHWDRYLAPNHHRLLSPVGAAGRPRRGRARSGSLFQVDAVHPAGHLAEISRVQAGAEGSSFARKHDRADTSLRLEFFSSRNERAEHRIVQGVHLVRAHQAYIGDAFVQINPDAIFHERSSHLAGKFTMRFGNSIADPGRAYAS
jgi:hypothetical protein